MIALIQRVKRAFVEVEGERIAETGLGALIFVCAQKGDTLDEAKRLANRCAAYRVFADDAGRMNKSLLDKGYEALVVSQFTLAADTSHGLRPGFEPAAAPELALSCYETFIEALRETGCPVSCGRFGADMAVSLINDGPATFWLEIRPKTTN
ncbi:MAG TPA: D-tyrosyl-tRNA(Tyr) deacylase [Sutterella sp.]|nr:D-tyrosyl-tRNA(Tyr) deacylase [Sutterella sp.]